MSSFKSSMGGGFVTSSTQDWKYSALQQLGLVISQRYNRIDDSFLEASNQSDRITFQQFYDFIIKLDALPGFNLTTSLFQKLFAEMDPHRKTYLTLKDWVNSLSVFNKDDHIMIELKNFLQCQFANADSAFTFLQSFGGKESIDFAAFSKATTSIIASRKLTNQQLRHLFKSIAKNKQSFNKADFDQEFENVEFSGKQVINPIKVTAGGKRVDPISQPGQQTGTTLTSKWERQVIDTLKRSIKASGKSIDAVFAQFDVDGSGDITIVEFRKAMKMLVSGLSEQEIGKIMQRVDANNDGHIDYIEFAAKFRDDPEFEKVMTTRANNRLAKMKEQMILYMTSANDAFRMVSVLYFDNDFPLV